MAGLDQQWRMPSNGTRLRVHLQQQPAYSACTPSTWQVQICNMLHSVPQTESASLLSTSSAFPLELNHLTHFKLSALRKASQVLASSHAGSGLKIQSDGDHEHSWQSQGAYASAHLMILMHFKVLLMIPVGTQWALMVDCLYLQTHKVGLIVTC